MSEQFGWTPCVHYKQCIGWCPICLARGRPRVFTEKEVLSLNEFQQAGFVHEFTCGGGNRKNHADHEGVLVATIYGWVCPFCDYTQDWAHDWMKNGKWKSLGSRTHPTSNETKQQMLEKAETELIELQATLDLTHDADHRAIKMWQDEKPGREMVWPDRAKMILWLLRDYEALAKYKENVSNGATAALLLMAHGFGQPVIQAFEAVRLIQAAFRESESEFKKAMAAKVEE